MDHSDRLRLQLSRFRRLISPPKIDATLRTEEQFRKGMDSWKQQLVQPLIDRLGPNWLPEAEVFADLNYPNMRAFWATELGLLERRRRWWIFGGPFLIRLSKKGWESQ